MIVWLTAIAIGTFALFAYVIGRVDTSAYLQVYYLRGAGELTVFCAAVMGACIGSLSALVQGVFQPASVRVLRGWQEGREYPLDKVDSHVGLATILAD